MELSRIIALYMDDCHARQLRPKTMLSYEQSLGMFRVWLEEVHGITRLEGVKDIHLRSYLNDLQKRGKYTFSIDRRSEEKNWPSHRSDYNGKISNITINNYLRNLRAFFGWLVDTASDIRRRRKREMQNRGNRCTVQQHPDPWLRLP